MNKHHSYRDGRVTVCVAMALIAAALVGCGGGGGGVVDGTGTQQDSGPNKTYLTVQASDADGDALQYQWRVTAGTIENRNARETVWTMPDGPGLHFAYVTISDGRGGYVEQQYAVSTDALGTSAPVPQAVSYTVPVLTDFTGSAARLRVASPDNTLFLSPDTGAAAKRTVYLPDVQVQVIQHTTGETVFSGATDLSGEISLPKLQNTQVYDVKCSTSQASAPVLCRDFTAGTEAIVVPVSPNLTAASNLRLFGHVSLADGGVCGTQDEFLGIQSAAAVQLLQADGTALTAFVRVNRFGDYAVDAAVPVKGSLKLRVQCESYSQTLDVPASPDVAGYVSTQPIELSHQVANTRPRVVKMVANGADGNVRGEMIIAEPGAMSNGLPGSAQFLTYKGKDTRLSACMYYRSLGAAKDCDAQGNMIAATPSGGWLSSSPVIPSLGFPITTRLQTTWLDEGTAAQVQPGKRPTTTLSPSMALKDGEPFMAFGTPGGDQQDQWTLAFFLRHVVYGMNLQEAIEAPSWHINHFPASFWPRAMTLNKLTLESRFAQSVQDELAAAGHTLSVGLPWSEGRLSACEQVRDSQGRRLLKAAANPRGMQGYAVGR